MCEVDTQPSQQSVEPIRMMLYCPRCLFQHVDGPDESIGWTNPPHISHQCTKCKLVWRPADVPTRGVMLLETRGRRDADPLTIAIAQAARERQVTDPSGLTQVEKAAQAKIEAVEASAAEVRQQLDDARRACQEGYAVMRAMAEEMDAVESPPIKATLANLSAARLLTPSVLPFQCENHRALNIAATARAEADDLKRQLLTATTQKPPARPAPSLSKPSSWVGALHPEVPTLTPRMIARGMLFVLIGFICMMMISAFFSFWERIASF